MSPTFRKLQFPFLRILTWMIVNLKSEIGKFCSPKESAEKLQSTAVRSAKASIMTAYAEQGLYIYEQRIEDDRSMWSLAHKYVT